MYKAIKYFTDLQDGGHAYNVGDEYPRKGLNPTAERITELASSKNLRGIPMIAAVEEEVAVPVQNPTPEAVEEPKKPKRKRKSE